VRTNTIVNQLEAAVRRELDADRIQLYAAVIHH